MLAVTNDRLRLGFSPELLGSAFRVGAQVLAFLICFAAFPFLQAEPVISEFMASNRTGLQDGHGNRPDWIEIRNDGGTAADLGGWRLTDTASNPAKFVFPSVTVPPGGRIVVMCSNRTGSSGPATHVDPLGYLHTNFALAAGGEYLALVRPNGTKSSEFLPAFPPQSDDLSYGVAMPSGTLVGASTLPRYRVPVSTTEDTATPDWRAPGYPDAAWKTATGPGLGFEAGTPVAYWPLNEGAGATRVADLTGNGHDGIPSGSASLGEEGHPSTSSTAAGFTATLGKISVPWSAALNPATFTFAAWVYPAGSTGTYQSLITSRQDNGPAKGYVIYITPSNRWEFWTAKEGENAWTYTSGGSVAYGKWTHIAISRDATGTNRIWINGVLKASTTGTFGLNTTHALHLGAGSQSGDNFRFNGRIDDATFWNTALDTALVQQHRDSTGASFPTPAYGGHYQTNVQGDLDGVNPGLYTRYPFTIDSPADLTSLTLRSKFDDAFVAYLNGVEVARGNFTGTASHASVADSDRDDSSAVVWRTTDLTATGLAALVPGANVLAIHAMRRSATHPDFLIHPELTATRNAASASGYFATATPGAANAAFTSPGPDISEVSHTPAEPLPGDTLTITARVKPRLAPIRTVHLVPRVQYQAEGDPIAMTDLGPWPGATDGSRMFTATLPNAGGASARQMLRYHLIATDTSSRTWRSPFITDTSDDDGKSQSPRYHGTVVKDPSLGNSAMPVLQWFTEDVPNSNSRTGTRASCFYQGRFHDNIHVRERGGYTSYGSQKFNFNRGDGLVVDETSRTLGEVNLNSAGADPTYLRPLLAFDLWRIHGHPACSARMVALYRNGSFQRMSAMIEQVDEDFLKRHDLAPDGALYKFVQRLGETPLAGGDYSNSPALGDTLYGVEKKTRLHENLADLNSFVAGINQTDAASRDAFLFRNLNIPNFVNFMAIRNLTGDADTNRKNFYLHRDSNRSGEWRIIPWDKDATFGVYYDVNVSNPWTASQTFYCDPAGTRQWCVLFEAGYRNAWIREMVARRIRQLADATIGPPGTPSGSTLFESRLESLRATLAPLPNGVTLPTSYNQRGDIDGWLTNHRHHTYQINGPSGSLQLVSAAAVTPPQIDILSADALPAAGTGQELECIRLENPGSESVDLSGWTIWNPGKSQPFFTFPPGTVIPPASMAPLNQPWLVRNLSAFRNRAGAAPLEFILGEYSGQLSARGETIELRAGSTANSRWVSSLTTPATPTPAQQSLRVTELMFAPPVPSPAELAAAPGTTAGDYEFIELRNTGTIALDLKNCAFTDGIGFVFPSLTLAPGQSVVLVRNPTAFTARYGTDVPIAGTYTGALDNAGDRIRLADAVGETIVDFSYDTLWYPPTDGGGHSLVSRSNQPDHATCDQAIHWAISGASGGSPGASDQGNFAQHYRGWLHDHFTITEQADPLLNAPNADPDHDGMDNLTEYAFARDPRKPDASSLVKTAREDGRISISLQRRRQPLDLAYTIESADHPAGPWTAQIWEATAANTIDDSTTRVSLRQPHIPLSPMGFIRVRATLK
jgi:CotH kinase protein/Concanavalin A-like lectin/glucanases superfamily/Lamin Tail Domain